MRIYSHEKPEEKISNDTHIIYAIDIQEEVKNDVTQYSYNQIVFPSSMPIDIIEAKVNRFKILSELSACNDYLKTTDWVESYYIKHLAGIELLSEDSSKWEIINKRVEAREFIRSNK